MEPLDLEMPEKIRPFLSSKVLNSSLSKLGQHLLLVVAFTLIKVSNGIEVQYFNMSLHETPSKEYLT